MSCVLGPYVRHLLNLSFESECGAWNGGLGGPEGQASAAFGGRVRIGWGASWSRLHVDSLIGVRALEAQKPRL